MQLVNTDETAWINEVDTRGEPARHKDVLNGKAGSPWNFNAHLHWWNPPSSVPRHHHNFDAIRVSVELPDNFMPKRDIAEGDVGYFPEGTYYGPLHHDAANITLTMQFGGASGDGYTDRETLKKARAEIVERGIGTFKDGVFYAAVGTEGKRTRDGYETVWEYVNKRPIRYVKARYDEPVVYRVDNFAWMPGPSPGVFGRFFGVFNERGTSMSMLGIERAARYELVSADRDRVLWVKRGSMSAGGHQARKNGAIHLERGETLEIAGDSPELCEIFVFGLPAFDAPAATLSFARL